VPPEAVTGGIYNSVVQGMIKQERRRGHSRKRRDGLWEQLSPHETGWEDEWCPGEALYSGKSLITFNYLADFGPFLTRFATQR
jgi:hypothetical protein